LSREALAIIPVLVRIQFSQASIQRNVKEKRVALINRVLVNLEVSMMRRGRLLLRATGEIESRVLSRAKPAKYQSVVALNQQ